MMPFTTAMTLRAKILLALAALGGALPFVSAVLPPSTLADCQLQISYPAIGLRDPSPCVVPIPDSAKLKKSTA